MHFTNFLTLPILFLIDFWNVFHIELIGDDVRKWCGTDMLMRCGKNVINLQCYKISTYLKYYPMQVNLQ